MLHKLILQNWRFNLCTDKQSFKYSQTLIIPIKVCAHTTYYVSPLENLLNNDAVFDEV